MLNNLCLITSLPRLLSDVSHHSVQVPMSCLGKVCLFLDERAYTGMCGEPITL